MDDESSSSSSDDDMDEDFVPKAEADSDEDSDSDPATDTDSDSGTDDSDLSDSDSVGGSVAGRGKTAGKAKKAVTRELKRERDAALDETAGRDFDIWDEHPQDPRHEESLRTGCFVVNPLGRPTPLDEHGAPLPFVLPNGFTAAYEGESEATAQRRAQAYVTTRRSVDQQVAALMSEINRRSFMAVAEFVRERADRDNSSDESELSSGKINGKNPAASGSSSKRQSKRRKNSEAMDVDGKELGADPHAFELQSSSPLVTELPVALVFAGANTSDHGLLFEQLSTYLSTSSLTPVPVSTAADGGNKAVFETLVTTVSAKQCPRTEVALKAVVLGFLSRYPCATEAIGSRRQQRHMLLDMALKSKQEAKQMKDPLASLCRWYEQHCERADAMVNRHATVAPPVLVLVFEDMECFEPSVLADLLHILSTHPPLRALPLVVVFGMATNPQALHGRLPSAVLNRLWMSKFWLQPAKDAMEAIVERLLIPNKCPVHFSASTVQFLLQYFLYDNLSVTSLTRAMR